MLVTPIIIAWFQAKRIIGECVRPLTSVARVVYAYVSTYLS